MSTQTRQEQGGRGGAIIMLVLIVLMMGAFSVVWVIPQQTGQSNPVQQAAQNVGQQIQNVGNNIAQSLGGGSSPSGGTTQTTTTTSVAGGGQITGSVIVVDTSGKSNTLPITVPYTFSFLGLWTIQLPYGNTNVTMFDSTLPSAGSISLQSSFAPSSPQSWLVNGNMTISVDGTKVSSVTISKSGTSQSGTTIATQTYTGQDLAKLLFPAGIPISVTSASHIITVRVDGSLTSTFSSGVTQTKSFSLQLIRLALWVAPSTGGSFTISLSGSTSTTAV